MDRILIAVDNNTFGGHVEATLRKVGYDIESLSTEYNLSEKLLSFNPDIILAKGNSNRLSALNIGKKLKDTIKFSGKVVLVMGQDQKINPQDLASLRADLLLFDPIGAMGLAMQILNLDPDRKRVMQEKLIRMAEIDTNFRTAEQNYLVQHGRDLDKEIRLISGMDQNEGAEAQLIGEDELADLSSPLHVKGQKHVPQEIQHVSSEYLKALSLELNELETELPLRIESYNHMIKDIDGDLRKGISKRDSQAVQREIHSAALVDPGGEVLKDIDEERKMFVDSLFESTDKKH